MKDVGNSSGSSSVRSWEVLGSLLVLLVFADSNLAYAANFTVNSTADAVDSNPGNGICADSSGNCTLRAAIMEANALAGADTITLPAGTYVLTIPGVNENAAAQGDLDITADLTINGAGATTTIVDGNGTGLFDRVFDILAGTVTISNVAIRGGNHIFGGSGGDGGGGGISNSGTLTLNGSTVSGNNVAGGGNNDNGGGILNKAGATATVNNSTVSGNALTGFRFGGGIANFGTIALNSSTVSGNTTNGSGGGISNAGSLTLSNSTISGNGASCGGAGCRWLPSNRLRPDVRWMQQPGN